MIVGLGIVGFIDDYLGVRARRNLGLRKRGKTFGIVAIAAAFAWLSIRLVHTSTHLSFTKPLGVNLGSVGWFVFAVLVIYATTNAVNLTDGLDGLAAGSSAFTFAAFMIIGFTEFRHPQPYGGALNPHLFSAQALDQAIVAAAMLRRVRGVSVVERGTGAHLHGRHRLARHRRRDGRARAPDATPCSCCRSWPGCRCSRPLSVIAQVISYRGFRRRVLRMAPIHHHFEVGGWSEFTVIVRFWMFAGICVALAIGHLLRRLPPATGSSSRDERAGARARRDGVGR